MHDAYLIPKNTLERWGNERGNELTNSDELGQPVIAPAREPECKGR
jgi:hypothetical protein